MLWGVKTCQLNPLHVSTLRAARLEVPLEHPSIHPSILGAGSGGDKDSTAQAQSSPGRLGRAARLTPGLALPLRGVCAAGRKPTVKCVGNLRRKSRGGHAELDWVRQGEGRGCVPALSLF